jgi:hypothetical protein
MRKIVNVANPRAIERLFEKLNRKAVDREIKRERKGRRLEKLSHLVANNTR